MHGRVSHACGRTTARVLCMIHTRTQERVPTAAAGLTSPSPAVVVQHTCRCCAAVSRPTRVSFICASAPQFMGRQRSCVDRPGFCGADGALCGHVATSGAPCSACSLPHCITFSGRSPALPADVRSRQRRGRGFCRRCSLSPACVRPCRAHAGRRRRHTHPCTHHRSSGNCRRTQARVPNTCAHTHATTLTLHMRIRAASPQIS